jgi:hypothetical protein
MGDGVFQSLLLTDPAMVDNIITDFTMLAR